MAKRIVRVKVALEHVRPTARRVVDLHSTSTLGELHLAIQAVMPWRSSHLHMFIADEAEYVDSAHGWDDYDGSFYDQDSVTLGALIRAGVVRLEYTYDMGDNWTHRIELAPGGTELPGVDYPRVIAGANVCPPEDCGGAPGYQRLLEAFGQVEDTQFELDPAEARSLREWAGDFDPSATFDALAAQERLDLDFGRGTPYRGCWGDWGESFIVKRGPSVSRVVAALDPELPAARFDSAPLVRDAAILAGLLTEKPLDATKSGNLTVREVLRVCEALGLELPWPEDIRSQADVPYLDLLVALLSVGGLLRRRGAVLALTPRGRILADPAYRSELATTLLRARFEELDLAWGTPGRTTHHLQDRYLEVLRNLKEAAAGWVTELEIWQEAVPEPVKADCVTTLPHDACMLVELRLLQPFVEMGLLESTTRDGQRVYRATALLGEWIRFDDGSGGRVGTVAPAKPSARETLDAFLAEVSPGLPKRVESSHRSNAELLCAYLDSYGPNYLSSAEQERYEQLSEEGLNAFCDIVGPEHIAPTIGMYLGCFLPKKVGVSEDGAKKAVRFARDLLAWLVAKGVVLAEDIALAEESVVLAAQGLPAAARFSRIAGEWCEGASFDDGDMVEDEFEIVRIDTGVLWLDSCLTEEQYGASPVPEEVSAAARVGMQFSGAIVPLGGSWRIVEVWTVYPG